MNTMQDTMVQPRELSFLSMLLSQGDPRVRNWPLMGSPAAIIAIVAGYLYFSLHLGPALMKNRRPFSIRPLVLAYNAVTVLLSVYFFVTMLQMTYLRGTAAGVKGLPPYSVFCEGTDITANGTALLRHLWLYMFTKISELLDTVFFVLLKKNDHISSLHILHHSIALSTVWLGVNNGITGQTSMVPVLNTAVHTVMYSYYALSALPSSLRQNLWWKKYVTLFQIVQFIALALHSAIPLYYDCGFARPMSWIVLIETTMFAWLFSRFYYYHYTLRKAD
ncbi:hypothetical protein HPB48_008345 [Haemaphysalis longicornis]|uniref:Elongation of very long chain fatty acids protein n=1 Tax=Haemaphysalis longicornis TaxID=44386 RepID=A0A9J6FYS5_HAELO|nr:hypothetical protein HPB48_008345 [Haemaphysalis longicornis]